MHKTPPTEEFPEIEWEQHELLEKDIEEREETYKMIGTDADGNEYVSTGIYVCGEPEIIHDIEPLTH